MRPGDWIEIGLLVAVFGFAFLWVAYHVARPSRRVGGRMSKRIATGLVVRRVLRAGDAWRWN